MTMITNYSRQWQPLTLYPTTIDISPEVRTSGKQWTTMDILPEVRTSSNHWTVYICLQLHCPWHFPTTSVVWF